MPLGGARTTRATPRARRCALLALALGVISAGLALPARGAVLQCGSIVTTNVTLTADVGPCASAGITVTANNVKIDLNGHRIFGSSSTGDGIGIRLFETNGVTLKNGSVTSFDAGVVIVGGGSNTVTKIKAIANIGSGVTTFGDGIVIDGSSLNVLSFNEVRANGPFSGISVIRDGAVGNKISKNVVQDNDFSIDGENNDVGIRLEANTRETTLKENVISFSGLDGISIFQSSRSNVLIRNTVKFNGFHDKVHRKGDGIRVFGDDGAEQNVIKSNTVIDNAANGLVVSLNATQNQIAKNKSARNGVQSPGSFDLVDENAGCDNNAWLENKGTRSQSCIQ